MGSIAILILGGLVGLVGLVGMARSRQSSGGRTPAMVVTICGLTVALLALVVLLIPASEPSIWAVLTWVTIALFVGFFTHRIAQWTTTPVPLSIPTTPAPTTTGGVVLRVLGEILLHRSLIRDSKYVWALSMLFHWSLFFVLLRHIRYFIYPVWGWVVALETVGIYSGYVLAVSLLLILMRRLYHTRQIYLSLLSDYFALILLLSIATTGILMSEYARVDLLKVKSFAVCVTSLTIPNLDAMPSLMFLVHFALVLVLLVYFPLSKLMHIGGAAFSPSRAARYDIKDRRYVNPWDPGPNVFEPSDATP